MNLDPVLDLVPVLEPDIGVVLVSAFVEVRKFGFVSPVSSPMSLVSGLLVVFDGSSDIPKTPSVVPVPALPIATVAGGFSDAELVPAMVCLVSSPSMVTADLGQKTSPASPMVVSGVSVGVCNSDAIAVENGLTKAQKWLIEWLREGVKHDEKHLAFLKDMEEDARRANKVARPPDGDEVLALMKKVLLDLKVGQPRAKGKRELLNLESSINYGITNGPS
jgi:hypothetical protein